MPTCLPCYEWLDPPIEETRLTISECPSSYRRGSVAIGSVLRLLGVVRQCRELVPAEMVHDPRAERVTDNVHGRSTSISANDASALRCS